MRHETCARTAAATPVLLEFLVHKFTFHWHIFFQDENSGEKFINVKKAKEGGGKRKAECAYPSNEHFQWSQSKSVLPPKNRKVVQPHSNLRD